METSNNSNIVNIVIYAETVEEAKSLVDLIFKERVQDRDIWRDTVQGIEVNGYFRYPSYIPTASPSGITDILIVNLNSAESENFATIKSYVDNRRGIPFKFLTSNVDLSQTAQSLEMEFVKLDDITNGDAKQKMINSAINLNQTLRNVFTKIDTDGSGFIDQTEILNASSQMGHPLNDEDAKEISKTLSSDGKISFENFKKWWVMGRTDFNSFRKVVEIELVVNNFIRQSSNSFNSYLQQIQAQGQDLTSQTEGLFSNCNVTSSTDYDAGTALNFHLTLGNDFNDVASALPAPIRETPFSFGVELKLKNAESGPHVIEVLSGLQGLVMQMIPKLEEALQLGVQINFRQVGNSVFIEVSYGGHIGDQLNGMLSLFNLSAINFSGGSDFHFTVKLSPVDILTNAFRDLVNDAAFFKIEGKGEYNHLKTLISYLINVLKTMNHGRLQRDQKALAFMLKIATVIRKIDFEFRYDADLVREVFIDAINSTSHFEYVEGGPSDLFEQRCNEWRDDKQPFLNLQVENIKPMAQMFLEPYKAAILELNLDDISVFVAAPTLRLYVKTGLQVRGLSNFASKTLEN